jgi:uncharacterized membrane protein
VFEVFPWLLFLHVMAAIVAFGPTFAFSIIGAMAGAEPQHANFATRASHRIGDILVEPFAISMFVTGVLLIWAADIPLFDPNWRWLQVSIVLYLLALGLSLFVSRPNVKRIIAMSGEGAAGPPPPDMRKAIATVQRVGIALTVLLVAIVFLMVVKPDFGF